jgi:hypothetical protein
MYDENERFTDSLIKGIQKKDLDYPYYVNHPTILSGDLESSLKKYDVCKIGLQLGEINIGPLYFTIPELMLFEEATIKIMRWFRDVYYQLDNGESIVSRGSHYDEECYKKNKQCNNPNDLCYWQIYSPSCPMSHIFLTRGKRTRTLNEFLTDYMFEQFWEVFKNDKGKTSFFFKTHVGQRNSEPTFAFAFPPTFVFAQDRVKLAHENMNHFNCFVNSK